jgi:kynurenine formamidase
MQRQDKDIAYKTHAHRTWNDGEADYNYHIAHHNNGIATIGVDFIQISHAGWNSKTTAHRLDRILLDNNVPFRVRIQNYEMVLYRTVHGTLDRVAAMDSLGVITFRRTQTSWILV